jgi:cell division protein DivIC
MRARERRRINIMLLAILMLYVLFMYGSGVWRIITINRQIGRINQEIQSWEDRNNDLEREIARLETADYVEQVARKELGLVQPKETVFLVTME